MYSPLVSNEGGAVPPLRNDCSKWMLVDPKKLESEVCKTLSSSMIRLNTTLSVAVNSSCHDGKYRTNIVVILSLIHISEPTRPY